MPKAVTSIKFYSGSGPTAADATGLKFNTEETKSGTSSIKKPFAFATAGGRTTPYVGTFTGVTGTQLTNVSISGVTIDSTFVDAQVVITSATGGAGTFGVVSSATATTLTVSSWNGTAPTLNAGVTGYISVTKGTNFSYPKIIALAVDTAASPSTTISNRKLAIEASPALDSGVKLYFTTRSDDAYRRADSGTSPNSLVQADSVATSADAAPSTAELSAFTSLDTTFKEYDSAGVSGGTTGKNGKYVYIVLGLSSKYTGSPSSSVALPNIKIQYDEA